MWTAGAGHIIDHVHVAAGTVIILGKSVSVIQRFDHGVLFYIIFLTAVLRILHVGFVDFRILFRPVSGLHYRNAGTGLHFFGRIHDLYERSTECGRFDAAFFQRIVNGGLHCFGGDRRTGNVVYLNILRIQDCSRELFQSQ